MLKQRAARLQRRSPGARVRWPNERPYGPSLKSVASARAKCAKSMIIGLYCESRVKNGLHTCSRLYVARACTLLADGKHHGASWPLANISQGEIVAYLGDDADTDPLVSACLFVSDLILGEFGMETLKKVDWQSRCEAAEAKNGALKETNSAQAQEMVALEAEVSAR